MIMDNLPAHKPKAIRKTIEKTEARPLFLPPPSPDYNPIEMAFSKLKAFLRKAAARTKEDLDSVIAEGIDTFTAAECRNAFSAV